MNKHEYEERQAASVSWIQWRLFPLLAYGVRFDRKEEVFENFEFNVQMFSGWKIITDSTFGFIIDSISNFNPWRIYWFFVPFCIKKLSKHCPWNWTSYSHPDIGKNPKSLLQNHWLIFCSKTSICSFRDRFRPWFDDL